MASQDRIGNERAKREAIRLYFFFVCSRFCVCVFFSLAKSDVRNTKASDDFNRFGIVYARSRTQAKNIPHCICSCMRACIYGCVSLFYSYLLLSLFRLSFSFCPASVVSFSLRSHKINIQQHEFDSSRSLLATHMCIMRPCVCGRAK